MVKTLHFSKLVSPRSSSKILDFSIFLFYKKIGKQNVFDDILDRKKACLRNKNI